METHHIQVQKTARYFTVGNPEVLTHLYVLHGYGQHPHYFLQKFSPLPNELYTVAPEGLHRFYIKGNYGRVGASWMTKEDRLTDIHDYVQYLDKLHQSISFQKETVVLGFSQGAATAVRWVCQGKIMAHKLILWAGSFPLDLELPRVKDALQNTKLILVVGNQDEYIDQPMIQNVQDLLDSHEIHYHLLEFEGGHEINHPTFKQALAL